CLLWRFVASKFSRRASLRVKFPRAAIRSRLALWREISRQELSHQESAHGRLPPFLLVHPRAPESAQRRQFSRSTTRRQPASASESRPLSAARRSENLATRWLCLRRRLFGRGPGSGNDCRPLESPPADCHWAAHLERHDRRQRPG